MIQRYSTLRKETRESRNGNARFRRGVRLRDGFRCHAERLMGASWWRCGKRTQLDPHHVYPRAQCGAAIFDPDVGLGVCPNCHEQLTRHEPGVRVPFMALLRAYEAIAAVSKVPPTKPERE